MSETLVQILFGWPGIITSILLSIAGLLLKKPVLLVAGGIVCIPFTYYMSNGFRGPTLVLPLLQFASAYAIKSQKDLIAWLLVAPMIMISVMLAYVVLTQ